MSVDNEITNPTDNTTFETILKTDVSRRKVVSGGLGLAATTFIAPQAMAFGHNDKKWRKGWKKKLMDFTPVPITGESSAVPRISEDYNYDVLIPWGDPIEPGGPAYNYPPSSADQALQIGIGHDGMWFFPRYFKKFGRGINKNGLLVVNHEFGRNSHVLAKGFPESLDDVRTSQHAHGVSVVEVKRKRGKWQTVNSRFAKRIHVNTPVEFSGPVAGTSYLETPAGNAPLGTVNNCGNGYTPWGTYLTCEENFNGYFGSNGGWAPTEEQARYGFSENGFGYGWHVFDERFDLGNADYKNEENRFGWIVEIDPYRPHRAPVKRTALGRFKHEGIALTIGRGGRAVGYMGDDQRFDYIYKFVSDRNWVAMKAQGISPLDEGTLYAARFNEDGTGDWLPLTMDNPDIAARFSDQAEVLTYARLAADIVGATPMDRPEWTTVAPNGDVFCTLTNNSQRTEADAANPLAPNADGHIIKWRDSNQHIGTTFEWEIFVIAQDTHAEDRDDTFSDPDGLWCDPDGRLFIQTDGGQQKELNDQMLVADSNTGEIRRIFEGVNGDEVTGVAVTPDRRTMFINIQHPGNGDPTETNFPVMNEVPDGVTIPRDATIVITRKDGGIIGS